MNLRRIVFSLVALAALSPPALVAQSTAGPFTISSASSPCATIGVTGQSTVGINVSGTFSMTLQPEVSIRGQAAQNTQVTPSTSSTAQATITATGVYSSSVAGADTFLLCVSAYTSGTATIYLNATKQTASGGIGGSSGGSSGLVPAGASLPATPCTANQLFNLTGAGGNTDTLYRCSGSSGIWQIIQPTVETIYGKNYGVIANGGVVGDATVSNGGTTITCNNNCNFINAAAPAGHVGDIVFLYTNFSGGVAVIPQTTILTVNSAQSITVASGTASQACVANCVLFFGPDDSAASDRAYSVAANSCATLQLPAGPIFVQQPEFNYQGTCSPTTIGNYFAPNVFGASSSTTTIIPTPNFNPAAGHGCGSIGTSACFFGVLFQIVGGLSIKAAGYNAAALTNKSLIMNNGALFSYFVASNWCQGCAGTVGYYAAGSQAQGFNGGVQNFGATYCQTTGNSEQLINWPCNTGGGNGLLVSGGSLESEANFFNSINVSAGATLHSIDDTDWSAATTITDAGTLILDHYTRNSGTSTEIQATSATAKVFIKDSGNFPTISSGQLSGAWFGGAKGSQLFDQGGNTFNGVTIPIPPSLLQSNPFNQGAGSSVAVPYSLSTTGSTLLQIFLRWLPTTNTLSSCTDTLGNTWSQNGATQTSTSVNGSAVNGAMLTVLTNKPAGGANTVTCTFSGSNTASDGFVTEWGGTANAYDGAIATSSGSTTAVSVTGPTTTNNADVVQLFIANQGATLATNACTPSATCVAFSSNTSNTGLAGIYQPIVPFAGAASVTGTQSAANDWVGWEFAIKPYAAFPTVLDQRSITGTAITAAKLVLSAGWGTTAAWSALSGYNNFTGTITASGTGQAANPTVTYTFPNPFIAPPQYCALTQNGGTQANGTFSAGSPTATGVTFTYSGTPGAGNTLFVHGECYTQ